MEESTLAVIAATWAIAMALGPVASDAQDRGTARSSHNVSIAYFVVLLVGFVLWVAYGIAASNVALIAPNAVATLGDPRDDRRRSALSPEPRFALRPMALLSDGHTVGRSGALARAERRLRELYCRLGGSRGSRQLCSRQGHPPLRRHVRERASRQTTAGAPSLT